MAHYVYRVYDTTGRLIYVGCTQSLMGRLRYHRNGYTAWWNDQAAKTVAKVFRTKREALDAESAAIRTENPRWNISGKWASNHKWSDADFEDFVTALINSPEFGPGTLRRARRVADIYFKRTGAHLDIDWDTAERFAANRLAWARAGRQIEGVA